MQFYRLRSFGSTDATTFTIYQDEACTLRRKDGKFLAITRTCHHVPEAVILTRSFKQKDQIIQPGSAELN